MTRQQNHLLERKEVNRRLRKRPFLTQIHSYRPESPRKEREKERKVCVGLAS